MAVLFGLLPWLLLETGLRVTDQFDPARIEDPFVGFAAVRPLFVLNDAGDRFEIPASRLRYFRAASFAAKKSEGDLRVFCLGGSTVQGRPYETETAFPKWLEIAAGAVDLNRQVEVVNCGGISYASYRVVPILEEVLGHQPDLVVLYTGHNEFLEARTYAEITDLPGPLRWVLSRVFATRTAGLAAAALGQVGLVAAESDRETLAEEVDARLDYAGGLDAYTRDDEWHVAVAAHYQVNLRRMVALCREAGVPMLLVDPVSNLRDCPPFKSAAPGPAHVGELMRLVEAARSTPLDQVGERIRVLRQAVSLEGRSADLRYQLAIALDTAGRFEEARAEYLRAKDEDLCPLRMTTPLREALFQVAESTGTRLVAVDAAFAEESTQGIVGNDLLVDHVHPNVSGHQRIAMSLVEEMVGLGLIDSTAHPERVETRFAEHLRSLSPAYFERGQARLERVVRWSRGRGAAIALPEESGAKGD